LALHGYFRKIVIKYSFSLMYGLPSNYPAFVEYPKGGKGGVKVVRVAVQK
jgi:hypothetical protein